jgi:hypothetical protein
MLSSSPHHSRTLLSYPVVQTLSSYQYNATQTSFGLIPFTSAPDEKNRPSPVRTVKIVLGWSFSSRIAATTSDIKLPPNALRLFGRLNYIELPTVQYERRLCLALIVPIWPLIVSTMSLNLEVILIQATRLLGVLRRLSNWCLS